MNLIKDEKLDLDERELMAAGFNLKSLFMALLITDLKNDNKTAVINLVSEALSMLTIDQLAELAYKMK